MKPIMVFGLSLAILAGAASGAAADGWKNSRGTVLGYKPPPEVRFSSVLAPPVYTPPAPPRPPPPQAAQFRPYQGSSVYSNRGGLDPYPQPSKPKGYISVYGNKN